MTRPVDALLEFLRAEQARGVREVALDKGARAVLNDWQRRSRKSGKTLPARQAEPAGPAQRVSLRDPVGSESARVAEEEPAAQPAVPMAGKGTPAEQVAALAAQAENWAPARSLGSLRETMVFSTGNPEAGLMLVGEAPGYQEERLGEPFVGPAGAKLNGILKAMGIERPEVYISNIVKFRPATENQTTNNRKPSPDEMAACLPFIRAEVEVVQPKCIVALGGTAAEGLLGLGGSVASMRGRWHDFQGIPARVSYHPAYLLHRNAGNEDKRRIWEDMLEVMEQLGMAISDKQRGFFLPKG